MSYRSKYGRVNIIKGIGNTVTIIDILGKGILNRISIKSNWLYLISFSVLIDAVETKIDVIQNKHKAVNFVGEDIGKLDSLPNVQFDSSLQIKITNRDDLNSQNIDYYVEYVLL